MRTALQTTGEDGPLLWSMAVGASLAVWISATVVGIVRARRTVANGPSEDEHGFERWLVWGVLAASILALLGLGWLRAEYIVDVGRALGGDAGDLPSLGLDPSVDPLAAATTGFWPAFVAFLFVQAVLFGAGIVAAYLHERLAQDGVGRQDRILRRLRRSERRLAGRLTRERGRIADRRRTLAHAHAHVTARLAANDAAHATAQHAYYRGVLRTIPRERAATALAVGVPRPLEDVSPVDRSARDERVRMVLDALATRSGDAAGNGSVV